MRADETNLPPASDEVVENDALAVLIASHSQRRAAAAEKQWSCSHRLLEDRMAGQESGTGSMA